MLSETSNIQILITFRDYGFVDHVELIPLSQLLRVPSHPPDRSVLVDYPELHFQFVGPRILPLSYSYYTVLYVSPSTGVSPPTADPMTRDHCPLMQSSTEDQPTVRFFATPPSLPADPEQLAGLNRTNRLAKLRVNFRATAKLLA